MPDRSCYAAYCWVAFTISGTFGLPMGTVAVPALAALVGLSLAAVLLVRPPDVGA